MHEQVTEGQAGVSLSMSAAQKQLLRCILLAHKKHEVTFGGLPLRNEGYAFMMGLRNMLGELLRSSWSVRHCSHSNFFMGRELLMLLWILKNFFTWRKISLVLHVILEMVVFMQFKLLVGINSSHLKISTEQGAFAWVLGNCRNKVAHHWCLCLLGLLAFETWVNNSFSFHLFLRFLSTSKMFINYGVF